MIHSFITTNALITAHEDERWEIERRQLLERHQLAKSQLKETFFLQRSQMLNRHQKVRTTSSHKSIVNTDSQQWCGELHVSSVVSCCQCEVLLSRTK